MPGAADHPPGRRLHLSVPDGLVTRYQRLARRGQRLLARQEALKQFQRTTLDLIQSRKKGWE